jgi:hypothetical protein
MIVMLLIVPDIVYTKFHSGPISKGKKKLSLEILIVPDSVLYTKLCICVCSYHPHIYKTHYRGSICAIGHI